MTHLDPFALADNDAPIDIRSAVSRRSEFIVVGDDTPAAVCVALAAALARAGIRVAFGQNDRPRNAARVQRYTHEGRTILRDGVAILHLERVDLGDERYTITPHATDVLTQDSVDLLNRCRRNRQATPATR